MKTTLELSPEALEKAAVRRARQERRLQAERAVQAANVLIQNRSLGVIALKDASIDYFMDGLEYAIGEDRVLRLDAYGAIQGEDYGEVHAGDVLGQLSRHRREHGGCGVVAFMGYNFGEGEGFGTPQIANRVQQTILEQTPGFSRKSQDPSVLLIGDGDVTHLPTHPGHLNLPDANPVGGLVGARLALDSRNELSSCAGIESLVASPQEALLAIARQFKSGVV